MGELQNLERLSLPYDAPDGSLRFLPKLKGLKALSIASDKLTNDGIAPLAALQNLEEVRLPEKITGSALKYLHGMPHLKNVRFEGDRIACSEVLHLYVDVLKKTPVEAFKIIASNSIPDQGKVTYLSLHWKPPFDQESLKHLAHFPDLEGITFGKEFKEDWLKGLGTIKNLKSLQIHGDPDEGKGTKFSTAGLKPLAAYRGLESLEFRNCVFDKDGLGELVSLPALKNLHLSDCRLAEGTAAAIGKLAALESLYLSDTDLRDEDLRHFANLSKLKFLSLPDAITLKGLVHLKSLKKLDSLQVRYENFQFADLYKLCTQDFGRSPQEALRLFGGLSKGADGKYDSLNWHSGLKATDEDLLVLRNLPPPDASEMPVTRCRPSLGVQTAETQADYPALLDSERS